MFPHKEEKMLNFDVLAWQNNSYKKKECKKWRKLRYCMML